MRKCIMIYEMRYWYPVRPAHLLRRTEVTGMIRFSKMTGGIDMSTMFNFAKKVAALVKDPSFWGAYDAMHSNGIEQVNALWR